MAEAPLLFDDDLTFVERRTDVRIVLSVPGRFSLASRRDIDGERREFPCRVINMSCHAVTLATPITGSVGERAIVHVDMFGKLEGCIMRTMQGGFVIEIIAPQQERQRLAAKIAWYEQHKNHDVGDHRGHVRIIPRMPHSTLVLADGTTNECVVMDVSVSGIAVSADIIPEIGTPVAVGKVVGRVVRHFPDGFAVQFNQVQEPEALETLIAPLR